MRFISPKTDFAFKKIFGSTSSKPILISFLNAIIYHGEQTIQDLEIIDPYYPFHASESKDSYLDVKATLDNCTTVIIEMQVINISAFEKKRIVYNLAKTYSNQLKYGQGHIHLQPVITLTITDFHLFPQTEEVITFWLFKEQNQLIDYGNEELKMVFVELPKFSKNLEELESITDKWIYFVKETPNLHTIPDKMAEVEEINQALTIANLANLSEKELDELYHQEIFWQDQKGYVINAREEGLQEGLQQGREQGREEGLQEGLQQGREEGEVNLIIRILEAKFGELPTNIKDSLAHISKEKLEELTLAILSWDNTQDLMNYLPKSSTLENHLYIDNNFDNNFTEILPNGIKLEMVYIPAGEFMMGSNEYESEQPIHTVTFKQGFYIGKYPITQAQYQVVMDENPSNFNGKNNPVECVSWHDAQEFCQKLSAMTGKQYKLPSESQWEYACRAGSKTRYYFGDDENQLTNYAWYRAKSNSQTHPVGQKIPNKWGLYDMQGNVWEWCEDDWHVNYENAPTDGNSWLNNNSNSQDQSTKVIRGGSWYNIPRTCRSACRSSSLYAHAFDRDIGFRIVSV